MPTKAKKPDLVRIASRIVNTPLFVQPDKLYAILGVVGTRIGLLVNPEDLPSPEDSVMMSKEGREGVKPKEGIAIIPVIGSLISRGNYDSYSGMTSYPVIRQKFEVAMDDPNVKGILFDIDSHGG